MNDSEISAASRRIKAIVITVSDSSSAGTRKDVSGPAVAVALESGGFQVDAVRVIPDDEAKIRETLIACCGDAPLVVTTGGTGIGPRDVTPEATRAVCERLLDGIPEQIRREGAKKTKFACLSRALCGTRGTSLILNLPGSPKGAVESLEAVLDILPHALRLIAGQTAHSEHKETL